MERQRKLLIAKTAVILGAIPVLLWAHEYGPDPGYSGVPTDNGGITCLNSLCHVGPAVNSSGGSIKVSLSNGSTYTPGVKQHLTVTIADPAATQRAWGFQLTARNASDTTAMAGTFTSTDNRTLVMCGDKSLFTEKELDFGQAQNCPSSQPLIFIEHSLAGYQATLNQANSASYEFDWTPPATNVGDIKLFMAGNAGPPGQPNQNNAHIYTATFTVSPGAAGAAPTVTKVQSASGFGGFSSIAPATWIEITGTNLASNTRLWSGGDFNGVNAPQSLDGTKVTIGGQPAFVYYISSVQVNAQVPSNVATGTQQLTVTTSAGTSANFPVTVAALQPGLLAPPLAPPNGWLINGKQYVIAQFGDNSFVLPAGSFPGLTTRPAKPGEVLTIYGIGFGPVVTASNQNIPAGQVVGASNQLVNAVQMQVNGVPANLNYAGLGPGQVGVYQFNMVVPAVPDGDWPLTFTQNGTKSTQTLLLSVHQ